MSPFREVDVKRRSPKNLAARAGYYVCSDEDPEELERKLSLIEGRAASTLRKFLIKPSGSRSDLPVEMWEFLSWLAARTPHMQRVLEENFDNLLLKTDWGHGGWPDPRKYMVSISHHGTCRLQEMTVKAALPLLQSGEWHSVPDQSQRMDFVRHQARYFFETHFRTFNWILLTAPAEKSFLVSDRPVVWSDSDGEMDLPSAMKHPLADVSIPLDRTHALLGLSPIYRQPSHVEPWEINVRTLAAAEQFVAAVDRTTIEEACEKLWADVPAFWQELTKDLVDASISHSSGAITGLDSNE